MIELFLIAHSVRCRLLTWGDRKMGAALAAAPRQQVALRKRLDDDEMPFREWTLQSFANLLRLSWRSDEEDSARPRQSFWFLVFSFATQIGDCSPPRSYCRRNKWLRSRFFFWFRRRIPPPEPSKENSPSFEEAICI